MGKKHKKRNSDRVQEEATRLAAMAAAAVMPGVEEPVTVPEAEMHAESDVEVEQVTTQEPQIQPQAVPEQEPAKAVEREPLKVKVYGDVVIEEHEIPKWKGQAVMAEQVYPSRSQAMINANIPVNHTAEGKRLIQAFDEYDAMMSNPSDAKNDLVRRIKKLGQILEIACPTREVTQTVASDLVRITFDRFAKNWGTLYTYGNIFCYDYALAGGAPVIDKLNMFFSAFIQLVEGARANKYIAYRDERLGMVIKNSQVLSAMARLRRGIERRIEQENER